MSRTSEQHYRLQLQIMVHTVRRLLNIVPGATVTGDDNPPVNVSVYYADQHIHLDFRFTTCSCVRGLRYDVHQVDNVAQETCWQLRHTLFGQVHEIMSQWNDHHTPHQYARIMLYYLTLEHNVSAAFCTLLNTHFGTKLPATFEPIS